MTDSPTLDLVADVGGTNTRVALARAGAVETGDIRRYANRDFPGLAAVLAQALAEAGAPRIGTLCVAVAGPVRAGRAHLTNLDWAITPEDLRAATGAGRIEILNDLQAQGHALDVLPPARTRPLIAAPAEPHGTRLVIGIGTGFNAALVLPTPAGPVVAASEAGQMALALRDADDLRLARHVALAGGAVVEDALSGRGILKLHAFARAEDGLPPDPRPAPEIVAAINAGESLKTGALFARFLGRAAGDLALVHLPFGGIWLCGGLARAMAPSLLRDGFDRAFADKGRFSALMADFPVSVIEDDYAALWGCARLAARPVPIGA